MIPFPIYCLKGALEAAGWPRRVGFLRRRSVVDRGVLETLYSDLLQRAMTLGAGKPAIAVRLLADQFQARDWATQPADELLRALGETSGMIPGDKVAVRLLIQRSPDEPPWHRLLASRFPMDPVEIALLDTKGFEAMLVWNFSVALRWGLGHPGAVAAALERERRGIAAALPQARAAGLELPPDFSAPTPRDVLEQSMAFVASYQERVRLFGAVPPQLASHPKILKYLARPDDWPARVTSEAEAE